VATLQAINAATKNTLEMRNAEEDRGESTLDRSAVIIGRLKAGAEMILRWRRNVKAAEARRRV
jgi:hypothetical protein